MNVLLKIELYDTTLRDGNQSRGINFTLRDKVDIAKKLLEIGFDYVEAGWPGANVTDTLFFEKLKHEKIVAFGSTKKPGTGLTSDKLLKALVEAGTNTVTVFGKTWKLHTSLMGISGKENLKIIEETIKYLTSKGKRVIFDAEHFFDGYKDNKGYALECLKIAEKSGAETIVLCDTNGGSLPKEVQGAVHEAFSVLNAKIGIHCHNDSGLAVANTLAAVEAGASHVQGTINGLGERCGNADLTTIIPNLALKLGYQVNVKLENLRETSQYIYKLANLHVNKYQPYVGDYAFSHKGGVHIYAVTKNPKAYEHINPSQVGNFRQIVLSNQAGKTTVLKIGEKLGFNLKKGLKTQEILKKVKELENKGYHLENADGKLWLLYAEKLGVMKKFFEVVEWKVVSLSSVWSMAWVRIKVNGKQEKEFSKGVGPVNAFDLALRKILQKHYPEMEKVKLINFKVSVINQEGTASKVEVFTEFSSGQRQWSTVGVDKNILKASEEALIDGYMFYLNRLNSKSLSKNNT